MNVNVSLLRRTGVMILVVASSACAGHGRRYHDGQMDFGAVRTVAVMPLTNLSRENVAADRVRDVFTNMLLATGSVYVVPTGETMRALIRSSIQTPQNPTIEEIVKLGGILKADAVITGTVKEYGEVRSGTSAANVVSISLQMFETQTGKVIWSSSTTKGGLTFTARLFGGGGAPMNDVTEDAVDDLLSKLFN